MGKRKLRFDQRKNYERKKYGLFVKIPLALLNPSELVVHLPLSAFLSSEARDADALLSRLRKSNRLPTSWVIHDLPTPTSNAHFMLCKLEHRPPLLTPSFTFTIVVDFQCRWLLTIQSHELNAASCDLLSGVAPTLQSVGAVIELVSLLDESKFCEGNDDDRFVELATQNRGTFKDQLGATVTAYLDTTTLPCPTVRHSECALLLSQDDPTRCHQCSVYRRSLRAMASRHGQKQPSSERIAPSSHTNYRYLSTPEKVDRLHQLHATCRSAQKKLHRLKARVAELIARQGVNVDTEITSDLCTIMAEEEESVVSKYPEDSFQRVFWQQQREASCRDKRGMRWHPAMIKWCLYLRHQSSKAYETLRSSGCLHLPSQRTLRDYTHCVKSGAGYSNAVDIQLMQAAGLPSCQEWERFVILLLDEMYIREDLVYEKHTGKLIGFSNLGDVSNHLLAYERMIDGDESDESNLAKTVMVFMVRGLFTRLRFPYAQFPCASVTGDLLFHPFWQAVFRLERMEFKVLGVTFDGASVNRRLVKLHNTASTLIYKVPNVYAADGRELFFFSDPPHLIKTTRNCWHSKCRSLWRNGKCISWQHLEKLYEQDRGKATGLAMVPKVKYEHIHLTSFSKMRVDLAAQVLSDSVAKALPLVVGDEAAETSKFASMFDSFFDIMNVSNFTNGTRYRKPFQHPYRHAEDSRIKWLEETFLPYLDDWETSVAGREGFSKTEKNRMLLSAETLLGLRMTAKSFTELVRYLFSLPAVKENHLAFLSNNLCQDPLENFFGSQRQRGGTSDNPNVKEFFKNTAALRVVNSFCQGPTTGNCRLRDSDTQFIGKENTRLCRSRRK